MRESFYGALFYDCGSRKITARIDAREDATVGCEIMGLDGYYCLVCLMQTNDATLTINLNFNQI